MLSAETSAVLPELAPAPVKVLVVEGDRRLRSVLGWLLDEDNRFCFVGETGTVQQALRFPCKFGLALVGLGVSGLGSRRTIACLQQRVPAPIVVVFAPVGTDPGYLRDAAMAEGAAGFLAIPDDGATLIDRLADLASIQSLPPAT